MFNNKSTQIMEDELLNGLRGLAKGGCTSLQTSRRVGGGITFVGLRSVSGRELLDLANKHGCRFTIPLNANSKELSIHFQTIEDIENINTVSSSTESEENQIATVCHAELMSSSRSGNTVALKFVSKGIRSESLQSVINIPTVINVIISSSEFSVIIAKPSDSKTSLYFLKRRSEIKSASPIKRKTHLAQKTTRRKRRWF